VTLHISEVSNTTDLELWLAVRNELEVDEPLLIEQLLLRRDAEPQRRELIVTSDDEVVAVATVGPKGSPNDLAYGYLGVRGDSPRREWYQTVLERLRDITRELGRARLELWAREDDETLISLLGDNGFTEVAREGGLGRDIPGPTIETRPSPLGITVEQLSASASFGRDAYNVAEQSWRDIPGETGIEECDTWLRLNVEHAAKGAMVSLHEGSVVGFAGLHQLAGDGLYENGLLAVLPHFRGRGIARLMKVAQLEWLGDHGARRIVTWNSETNLPARALNLSLGYTLLLTSIAFQGTA
jgi:GNAT superfamily N-acetyltransferase